MVVGGSHTNLCNSKRNHRSSICGFVHGREPVADREQLALLDRVFRGLGDVVGGLHLRACDVTRVVDGRRGSKVG